MKVLVVGSGGREHAIVWALQQSIYVNEIYCAPGNAGTAEIAANVDIKADNISALINFVKEQEIDITIVGPEDPLAAGIVDEFIEEGLKIFGPTKAAAKLESSKVFTKHLLRKVGIPTAPYRVFLSPHQAWTYAKRQKYPLVIKADGLAAGKGVIVCHNSDQAWEAIKKIMIAKEFGDAGKKIVIEECLIGEEASFIAIVDGNGIVLPLASSQDHKARDDGDKGPNTGGMGAYSPAPVITEDLHHEILETIAKPIVYEMANRDKSFTGVLYLGLMIVEGRPYVLEVNVRFGDPEIQPILARLNTDFGMLIADAVDNDLDGYSNGLSWADQPAVCVVMASKGYPGSYKKGLKIRGIDNAGTNVFHAGTAKDGEKIVTSGGRVLGVTALGKDIKTAQKNAYKAVNKIQCEDDNLFWRTDIANKAIKA